MSPNELLFSFFLTIALHIFDRHDKMELMLKLTFLDMNRYIVTRKEQLKEWFHNIQLQQPQENMIMELIKNCH
jgi:hypothetical protein